MKLGGIIFDMDGLLIDSERMINEAVVRGGREMGIKDIERISLLAIGSTNQRTREIYYENCGDVDFDRLMELKHMYLDEMLGDGFFPLKPGAEHILRQVKDAGYRTAVGSSTREWAVRKFLGGPGLLKYFDVLVCGDMGCKSKPDPDIFLACAEKMRLSPRECAVLEDSPNGIRAAHAAGMLPIMIPDMIEPTEEIISMTYAVKKSLYEAAELFEGGLL